MKNTFNDTARLSFLGPKIWDLFPKKRKELPNVNPFKNAIKKKKPQNCPRYVKNTFKISVLFDTFPDTLDNGLLPNFVSIVREIGTN